MLKNLDLKIPLMKTKTLTAYSTTLLLTIMALTFPTPLKAATEESFDFFPSADTRVMNVSEKDPVSRVCGAEGNMGVFQTRDNSLICFDLSSIPKNAKILNATLELTSDTRNDRNNANGGEMNVYRVTKAWDEMGATWTAVDSSAHWENPGGDAVGTGGSQLDTPYATNSDTGEPSRNDVKFRWDITNLVSEWVSGKFPNDGLLIRTEDKSNKLHFFTKEFPNKQVRPVLKVRFSS